MKAKNTMSRRQLMCYALLTIACLFITAWVPAQPVEGEPAAAPATGEGVTLSVMIAPESEYGEITPFRKLAQIPAASVIGASCVSISRSIKSRDRWR